ncbi:MAG: Holliday junction branch migration protein RuvA [Crocinitomicaceae bacterium]|nr:Holliday junction branch migration protein RuvA [Crocinitomicaceae bacterium]
MIAQLRGNIIEKTPTYVILDCGGVGYHVKISLYSFGLIKTEKELTILTEFIVREDAQLLYGFMESEEREMFRHLISVSGIGPNTAMIMLSSMTPVEIMNAIVGENVNAIKSVKGIGLKTAQRVIVDLKDKVSKLEITSNNIFNLNNTNRNEAFTALSSLGFEKKSIEKALDKVFVDTMSVEELIKAALKIL